MSGSISDNSFYRHSLLALMLLKLLMITRNFFSNPCLMAFLEACCDDVCWGGPIVSGSKSDAIAMCDVCDGVLQLISMLTNSIS